MTGKIFIKLIAGVIAVLLVASATLDILVSRLTEQTYIKNRRTDLIEKASMIADLSSDGFSSLPREEFVRLAKRAAVRMTVIAPDGKVLADSDADPARMNNHRTRPEVAAALSGKTGSSVRISPTIGIPFLYVAIPVPAGALRLAVPLADIREQLAAVHKQMLLFLFYSFIPAMLLAAVLARMVSGRLATLIQQADRLAEGNFEQRLNWKGRSEIALLGRKLDETAGKLESTFNQLKAEHAELERMEKIRKDFIINVSHELRTPLASIQGYTETLLDGAIQDREHNLRFLHIIRKNAERLANLTSDLVVLSRIELRQQKFKFEFHAVRPLLEDTVEFLKPLADKKQIEIKTDRVQDDLRLFADPEAVQQALSNLLDNAIKYTPENGKVHVSARMIPAQKDCLAMVEILVEDNGPGIPAEELPRLFERFYRVDKARSRELGGTGLGLAIVKHLIRAMGGEVRVESRYGEGARFSFTIPQSDWRAGGENELQPELTTS